jgi:polar amino acid transport system substrate-binding protein
MYKGIYFYFIICLFFSAISHAENLKIYTENGPPLNYLDKNGKMTGFAIEIVNEIQKRVYSNHKIEMVPWARAYSFVTDPMNSNVALFSMTFTEKRRNLFKWVGPIAQASWQFYARADSTIRIHDLEDAKRVSKIGTYRKDVREDFLKSSGFTNIESITIPALNLHRLLSGRIDLWITSNVAATKTAENEGIDFQKIKPIFTFKTKGLYIAFHKNTPDSLVNKWQQAYNDMKDDDTLESIFKKWNLTVPTYTIPL